MTTWRPTSRAGRDHGQHRDVDVGVVLAVAQRQRPGVRRGPEEDHREQHDRHPGQRAGDRGPADQRREAAGQPAPDDVLGRPALEQHRVAEDVERVGDQRQHRGQRVDPQQQHHGRQHREHEAEDQRGPRGDEVARQRPAPGAAHLLVDVAVVDAVEDRGRAGREAPADHGGRDQAERRDALRGEEHHRDGGEQQQLDDARLGEPDVRRHDVADAGPLAGSRRSPDSRRARCAGPTGRRRSQSLVRCAFDRWDWALEPV